MNIKTKEFKVVAALSLVAAVLVVSYLLAVKAKRDNNKTPTANSQYQKQYDDGAKAVPTVESASSLDSASKSMDSTDTSQIDIQLKQLDSDSSTF